jgi:ElaB/YqjD/DUF883 family membrane-anchored ribosome-binding protein
MTDLETMHEEIRRIREDTNADRDVRESLQSIERALAEMVSAEGSADPDELKEVRAKIDRLADDAGGQTATELDRLREQVREFERDAA